MAASSEFNLLNLLLRIAFSLVLVFVTFNPSGHSYYHWLTGSLPQIQPPVVIAGIVLAGAWLFFLRSTFASMGLLLGVGMSWAHLRARLSGQASVDRVDS